LLLATEHRAAPAAPPVYLELVASDAGRTHLEVVAELHAEDHRHLQHQVLALLEQQDVLTRTKLRESLSVKNERLGAALESLQQAGRIRRTSIGWQRVG
jgi:DNA-binding MarR family transcriptional regulator